MHPAPGVTNQLPVISKANALTHPLRWTEAPRSPASLGAGTLFRISLIKAHLHTHTHTLEGKGGEGQELISQCTAAHYDYYSCIINFPASHLQCRFFQASYPASVRARDGQPSRAFIRCSAPVTALSSNSRQRLSIDRNLPPGPKAVCRLSLAISSWPLREKEWHVTEGLQTSRP